MKKVWIVGSTPDFYEVQIGKIWGTFSTEKKAHKYFRDHEEEMRAEHEDADNENYDVFVMTLEVK